LFPPGVTPKPESDTRLMQTLQLEKVTIIHLHDSPKLLVEWSPRWHEFVTNIGPAFARSRPRLAGEAPDTLMPYRGMFASYLMQLFLLFVLIVLPRQIEHLRPYAAPKVSPYEVIYYSGDELPRTQDLGGAQSGATGRAGGQEAHHPTQTIHVARGASLTAQVVDAPDLKLPSSSEAVANLLAVKANPGPPPAEGLHSSLTAPSLPANVIAPAQANVSRNQSRGAPALNAAVVPPAPGVRSEHTLFAPVLDPSIIAPAPNVSRDRAQAAPSLNPNVIGPASTRVSRDKARSAPALSASVIPPAPAATGREVAPSRVRMNDVAVVPPPVSAPEREAGRNAKLNLPAPSVIAPPPSSDSSHDLRRLESGAGRASPAVVPPPPTPAANNSLLSNIIGKFFGTQDVVPPPPTVSSGNNSGGDRSAAAAPGGSLGSNVIPPPPSVGGSTGGSGTARGSASGRTRGATLGGPNVIPPPPSVTGNGQGSPSGSGNSGGSGNGTLLADNIIPPPPSVGSGPGLSGSGRRGSGLGGPGDTGSVLAPPKSAGGNGDNSGIVISSQPGSRVGAPGSGGKGSLAMSPGGGDQPGLGGSGGGTGIGRGEGPGSGLNGEGPGAGKTGAAQGADPNARGGISPTPGPGGAGDATTGAPAVPGVDVRGGSTTTVVTLPSFGSESGSDPNLPGRTTVKKQEGPAITIVATSRSGGAFDFYGKLPGDNYSVYVDTSIGTVVMQFAEVNPVPHGQGTIVGPQGLRTDLPAGLPHARVVIKCRLDASGNLRNLQVLEPGPAAMTAKIMAALPTWKFRPAMRGVQPVEVNAILGFNIDTNDRN
jgi:hypothetical protein